MTSQNRSSQLDVRDCGLADFRGTLDLQHRLVEQRRAAEIGDTVIIVEHRPVITLGARQTANKLLVSRDDLAGKDIDVVEIRRGGGTTAHNPGQIVFYPIPLDNIIQRPNRPQTLLWSKNRFHTQANLPL